MKWYNVTCTKTKHIIPAQKWLFNKYVGVEPIYLDVENNDINNWGKKVASMLPNDEYIIFGLDDYLPIDYLDISKLKDAEDIVKMIDYERFELGWGASRKKGFVNYSSHLVYGETTPYKVSCQFSIWKTSALKRELNACTTPWNFEVKGTCKAACFEKPVLRWIEESALSNRQPNKVNILGLKSSDVNKLQELGHLSDNLIFGWNGATELPIDKTNLQYGFNY